MELLPTVHEGATGRAMEKKGIRTEKGEFNRWIKATNAVIRDIKKKIALLCDWIAEAKEMCIRDRDGTAIFTADLPIGNSYYVKEEQAPSGYQRNKEDIYSFKFSYTNDSEADVSFSHTFVNERVTAKIFLKKKDAETNKAEPQGDATLEKAV